MLISIILFTDPKSIDNMTFLGRKNKLLEHIYLAFNKNTKPPFTEFVCFLLAKFFHSYFYLVVTCQIIYSVQRRVFKNKRECNTNKVFSFLTLDKRQRIMPWLCMFRDRETSLLSDLCSCSSFLEKGAWVGETKSEFSSWITSVKSSHQGNNYCPCDNKTHLCWLKSLKQEIGPFAQNQQLHSLKSFFSDYKSLEKPNKLWICNAITVTITDKVSLIL